MEENKEIKTRVLLVDDDPTLLGMYQERLTMQGYEVITASNGEDALAKAIDTLPQVILLDVMMPKINGFDVLNILKETPETKDIPVIILTALAQDNHKKKGLGDGAFDFIVKSETMPKDVVFKIENAVNQHRQDLEQSANSTIE